jgi:hypothetical protein
MVSAAAGFHGNLGLRKFLEERGHLRPVEIDAQDRPVVLIDAM